MNDDDTQGQPDQTDAALHDRISAETFPKPPATLLDAMLAFQAEVPILAKRSEGEVKGVSKTGRAYDYTFKYADYPTIMEAIQPLLTKHELIWTVRPAETEQGRPALDYELIYAPNGEAKTGRMPLMLGANPTAQAHGSALTYGKRHALTAVLNLVADADDDGKIASKRATGDARPLPKASREKMLTEIGQTGKQLEVVLGAVGLERAEDATVGHAKQIKALLKDA
jgi:hypothetical protein